MFGNIPYDRTFSAAETLRHVDAQSVRTRGGANGTGTENGAASAPLTILVGPGGFTDTGHGGAGGLLRLEGGKGGAALKNNGLPGAGSAIEVQAGAGGTALNVPGGGGGDVNILAGDGGSSIVGGAGGSVHIRAGAGAPSNGAGGHVVLTAGAGHNTGSSGYVAVKSPMVWGARSHEMLTMSPVPAASLLKGILVWIGTGNTTFTLPAREDFTNVIYPLEVGMGFDVYILNNTLDFAITLQVPPGCSWYGTAEVAPAGTAHLYIRFSDEVAYSVYRLH